MKKVIMSLLLISIVIISNFTMTFAAVGGENASTEEENNRLFQECYEEYLAEIEKIDQQNSPADASGAHARGYIDQAESSATSDRQTVTNATLKRAQKDSAGVIYKFAKEVGIM